MKGIILAGGNGRRLAPLTDVTNKHLLPVYDKPMIYFPLKTLVDAGIKDILIVTATEYAPHFRKLLSNGSKFKCNISYACQDEALGIAHALALARDFANGDNIAVILGDNIYEDNLNPAVSGFEHGGHVFLKKTNEAERFGVAEIDGSIIVGIEEKPVKPKTDLAVTGFYLYDNNVFEIIKGLKPSGRGELEITDVNNEYIRRGEMTYSVINGNWTDCGTFESLFAANKIAREIETSKN